jgi:outer membrane autotransporter protein
MIVGTVTLPNNNLVTLNPPANPLVQWTYSDGILRQVRVPNVDQVVINVAPPNQPNVAVILNSVAREDLVNVVNQSGNVSQLLEALQPDAIALGSEPANQAAENASQMISGTTRGIDNRINSVQIADIGLSGVSAGDTQTHGAWVTPFFGDIRQKQLGTSPGYAAKYFGTILGFDTLLKDDSTLGFAVTLIKNLVNHKDSNNGDKTVIQTAVFSLYGLKNLTDNWFVQGVASIGTSKIDGKEVRFTFPNTSTASADYNSISYTTEITGGYSHFLSANTILTPLVGIEHTRLNKIEYTETGAGAQNLTINRKVFNKAELIAGAKFNYSIMMDDFTFIPEVHGFVRYNTMNNGIKLAVSLPGQSGTPVALVPRTAVQTRTTYLVGAGFEIKKSTFEYGVTYDARIDEKYISHQGVLKLRLVF